MPSSIKKGSNLTAGVRDVLATIAAMQDSDRKIAEHLHEIITTSAPELAPKTWYGMPAYANKDGKVVCFFGSTQKMEERYMTLGFSEKAKLDDGNFWPTAYAIKDLTSADEKRIAELIVRAIQ